MQMEVSKISIDLLIIENIALEKITTFNFPTHVSGLFFKFTFSLSQFKIIENL